LQAFNAGCRYWPGGAPAPGRSSRPAASTAAAAATSPASDLPPGVEVPVVRKLLLEPRGKIGVTIVFGAARTSGAGLAARRFWFLCGCISPHLSLFDRRLLLLIAADGIHPDRFALNGMIDRVRRSWLETRGPLRSCGFRRSTGIDRLRQLFDDSRRRSRHFRCARSLWP